MADGLKIAEAFFLVCICISALTGNTILFFLVAKTPALQTKGNIFILNLAAADLLVAVVNMPITIATVISEDWILGEEVCIISGFLTLLTFVASCMALSMISVNRYHAIVHWTTYRNTYTRWKCAIYVGIVWAITIGLSLPPFFGWAKFDFDKGQSYCFAEWRESKSYTIFMIAACLLGPLTVMSYCYVKILKYHRKCKRDIRTSSRESSVNYSVNSVYHISSQETAARPEQSDRKKLTRTIISLIVVFAICWSPFAIIMIVQVFGEAHVPRAVDFGSLVLGYMNSLCNVFVYNATNKRIRNGYKKLFCCSSPAEKRQGTLSGSAENYV